MNLCALLLQGRQVQALLSQCCTLTLSLCPLLLRAAKRRPTLKERCQVAVQALLS